MPYLYATERPDYSHLASGRVFYSLAGHPAFPIRLASEIFQRCLALRRTDGLTGRVGLYDPCCGSGYLAATLAYLHAEELKAVFASDVDQPALDFARRNLGLLRPAGLAQRSAELADLWQRYAKESHRLALASAAVLEERIAFIAQPPTFEIQTFAANALSGAALAQRLSGRPVDVVITDVPYGQHSAWSGLEGEGNPLQFLLSALSGVLAPGGLAAIVSDKGQKVPRAGWRRRDHFQVGLRRVEILQQQ